MASPSTSAIQPPPGPDAQLTLPGQSTTNPAVFEDAMVVRVKVFVDEQNVPAESEIDADDARSWHWVIYESESTSPASKAPIATIRLVPPPQPPHELLIHPEKAASQTLPEFDWSHEPCIKLTRVAVVPKYRGKGLGRRLVDMALSWAAEHAAEINNNSAQFAEKLGHGAPLKNWTGLVLVHAQVDVEQMYQGLGFTTDESLGRWDEEGIDHVGMYRQLNLA